MLTLVKLKFKQPVLTKKEIMEYIALKFVFIRSMCLSSVSNMKKWTIHFLKVSQNIVYFTEVKKKSFAFELALNCVNPIYKFCA
jgi:hypothetical protein